MDVPHSQHAIVELSPLEPDVPELPLVPDSPDEPDVPELPLVPEEPLEPDVPVQIPFETT